MEEDATALFAERGDPAAQTQMALRLKDGSADQRKLAFQWCKKAAEQGWPPAEALLGIFYSTGNGIDISKKRALKWLRKGAQHGSARAQYELGSLLLHGTNPPGRQDTEEAVQWYQKAAEHGFAQAQLELARLFWDGGAVPKNEGLASFWLHRAAALGNAEAQYQLGMFLLRPENPPAMQQEAVLWLRSAADQGYAAAFSPLGEAALKGRGMEPNAQEAARLFEAGTKLGDIAAQTNLGLLLADGNGTKQDVPRALALLRAAAQEGYAPGQCALGLVLFSGAESGRGIPTRPEVQEAIELWYEAADQQCVDAYYYLGCTLVTASIPGDETDTHLDIDICAEQTRHWWEKAAKAGHPDALYNMGCLWYHGDGSYCDQKAFEYWQRAAQLGCKSAQSCLYYLVDRRAPLTPSMEAFTLEGDIAQILQELRERLVRADIPVPVELMVPECVRDYSPLETVSSWHDAFGAKICVRLEPAKADGKYFAHCKVCTTGSPQLRLFS